MTRHPSRSVLRGIRSSLKKALTLAILALAGTALPAQPPSDLDFAYACRLAYLKDIRDLEAWEVARPNLPKYGLLEWWEDDDHPQDHLGLRAVALRNEHERIVIIAFRGTEPNVQQNVIIDAGIFLTLAGDAPVKAASREIYRFSQHYGDYGDLKSRTAGMLGTLGAVYLASRFDREGDGQLAAISGAFTAAGFPMLSTEDMQGWTRRSVDKAIAFYRKTQKRLLEESGDPEGSRIYRWAVRHGWLNDPRMPHPGGYTIYVTGHSLGGFLAQVVAASQGCPGTTFNAPGAKEYVERTKIRLNPAATISLRNLFRQHDVVGSYATHLGTSEPLGDFYDVPAEEARLARARAQKERECEDQRQRRFERAVASHEAAEKAFPERYSAYLGQRAQWEKDQQVFVEQQGQRNFLTRGYHALVSAPKEPKPPERPQKPRFAEVAMMVPNPYGDTPKAWAKEHYSLGDYLLKNHSLESIIEQLEGATEADGRAEPALRERKEIKAD